MTSVTQHSSFRKNYAQGVDNFYTTNGSTYRNPHLPILRKVLATVLKKWSTKLSFHRCLDLACGSGEVTEIFKLWFESKGVHVVVGSITNDSELDNSTIYVEGTDPFTADAFEKRLGVPAETYSFEDIEEGALENKTFDTIVSSYAMHLIDPSRLYSTCQQLAIYSHNLIVVSPIKKPDINIQMGWNLEEEFLQDKVHVRRYSSVYH